MRFSTASSTATASGCNGCCATRRLTLLVAGTTLILTVVLYIIVPKGFFPLQDTGSLQVITEAPQSISFAAMSERQNELVERMLQDPAVANVTSFIGLDGTNATLNSGRMQITLKAHGDRDAAPLVIAHLQDRIKDLAGITAYFQPVQDLTIEDRISRTQYQFTLEDASPAELSVWVPKLTERLNRLPELADVASDLQDHGSQAYLTIDRATAMRFGITPAAVDNALYDAFGQRLISDHFHPVQPVPRGAGGQAFVPAGTQRPVHSLYSVRNR